MMPSSPRVISLDDVVKALPKRQRDAHKGDFGHVLIVGGNEGMAGAARLAGEAALRSGAGLVRVATRAHHVSAVISGRPELLVVGVEDKQSLLVLLQAATVVVVGPGLGRDDWAFMMWSAVMESRLPLVVDGDALNELAVHPFLGDHWILTPHPKEAARLLACSVDEVQRDRQAAVIELQQRYGGVAVLKGAGSLVTAGAGKMSQCCLGNPGMASGGMGDVLSGLIGGLVGQGLSLLTAAEVGVYVHAWAGDEAAKAGGERGLVAMDLLPFIRRGVNGLLLSTC
jgi:hydroxyethylthiazole kinase-like uncharacterized protein yjeF